MSKMSRLVAIAAAALLSSAAISCSDLPTAPVEGPGQQPPPPPPAHTVASVSLSLTDVSLEEGSTQQLTATPRDASGAAITGLAVVWTSSQPSVAEVAQGTVTAVRAGTTTITASVNGKSAQAIASVTGSAAFDLLYSVQTQDIFRELFVMDIALAEASPARLFPNQQWASQARPSPDGQRIAYVAPNPIIGDPSIFVANRDGSNSRMIAAFIGEAFQEPVWSPDGSKIAFVRTKFDGMADRSRIWIVNADGSNAQPLTSEMAGSQSMPAWSPRLADGTERIAYVQDIDGAPRIWTIRTDGSDARRLGSATGAYDMQPAWSPDGSTIAFQRTTAFVNGDIWLMSADGSNERALMLSPLAGTQLSPTWRPDGRMIAFTSGHESAASMMHQVYTVWVDGRGLARRTADATDKATPVWLSAPQF